MSKSAKNMLQIATDDKKSAIMALFAKDFAKNDLKIKFCIVYCKTCDKTKKIWSYENMKSKNYEQ